MSSTTNSPQRDPDAFPLPSGREEAWRFTPRNRLRDLAGAGSGSRPEGKLALAVRAGDGVEVTGLEPDDPRIGFRPADRVSAAALANFGAGIAVALPAGSSSEAPVVVTVTAEGGTAFGHLLIEVGRGATGVVVLDHAGSGTVAEGVEVRLGDGAHLDLLSVADWASDTVHLGQQDVRIGRDATLRSVQVSLGGDLVRLTTTADFAGPGGDATFDGLYFADADQHLEHRLRIEHAAPHCRSRVTYKGALFGAHARTVWVGDVLIRPEAVGTDSYELNRNLLLSEGARADSVPNLEILTGEVARAGHASATGRFDEEALFYLCSRGIPPVQARHLVIRAFFAEVIGAIRVPEMAERVSAAIEAELARALG
jgi:Fe-S cluster assembly protein SufD